MHPVYYIFGPTVLSNAVTKEKHYCNEIQIKYEA